MSNLQIVSSILSHSFQVEGVLGRAAESQGFTNRLLYELNSEPRGIRISELESR